MKKALLAATLLAVMGSVNAAPGDKVGNADFQWAGTIPGQVTMNGGYFVVNPDGTLLTDSSNGTMSFSNEQGTIDLLTATSFSFKVMHSATEETDFAAATDLQFVPFGVQLTEIKTGVTGTLVSQQNGGYFGAELNGNLLSDLSTAAPTQVAADDIAILELVKADANGVSLDVAEPTATPDSSWHVHAALTITEAAAAI